MTSTGSSVATMGTSGDICSGRHRCRSRGGCKMAPHIVMSPCQAGHECLRSPDYRSPEVAHPVPECIGPLALYVNKGCFLSRRRGRGLTGGVADRPGSHFAPGCGSPPYASAHGRHRFHEPAECL
uniref:Uncharacterized protein n=1 Tax=Sphaerodactylus townsendi TaxID=933632 RepID=A0ACB8EMR0_9SAUR